ncbi:MAG: PP2C family protein-serine/threonine phosphatase [Candidatus Auribacterota bacterium]|nr:PP2C family protein-serine/threonine phosphatase [Candidatus Auribacterota bacterium]
MREIFKRSSDKHGMELSTRELRNLKEVHQAFLPKICPHCRDISISAKNVMKFDLGGDFYDFTKPEPKLWGFWIGDATGKGIVASSVSAVMYGLLHHMCKEKASPGEVVAELNEALYHLNTRVSDLAYPFSATSFYGVFDSESGSFKYASAGHPAPIMLDAKTSEVTQLSPTGPPLGFSMEWSSGEVTIPSIIGKKIVMFTDGLLYGKQNVGFTTSELTEFISSLSSLSAGDIVDTVFSETEKRFKGNFEDDLTIITADFSNMPACKSCVAKDATAN